MKCVTANLDSFSCFSITKRFFFKQKQTKNIFHFSVTVLGNVQVTKLPQNKMQSIVFFALLVLLFGLPAGVLIRGNLGLLLFLLVMLLSKRKQLNWKFCLHLAGTDTKELFTVQQQLLRSSQPRLGYTFKPKICTKEWGDAPTVESWNHCGMGEEFCTTLPMPLKGKVVQDT